MPSQNELDQWLGIIDAAAERANAHMTRTISAIDDPTVEPTLSDLLMHGIQLQLAYRNVIACGEFYLCWIAEPTIVNETREE